jgi:beta-aspartyl-peptidase (threonine type)
MPSPRILIHGGASPAFWRTAPPGIRAAAFRGLAAASAAGAAVLRASGTAIDAVCAAVTVLEDDPLFNAGTGGVRTSAGTLELDAALMCGETSRCAAICGVNRLHNPIDGCRRMLEAGKPAFMWGPHAEQRCLGLGATLRRDDGPVPVESHAAGTVGALALDAGGRLAAATSTGGLAGKMPGRIGDSPVIGAGTWADQDCAVSCTGDGELFIRCAVSHNVALSADPLPQAATRQLGRVAALGGMGGLIAMRADGSLAAAVTGGDIARAWWTADGVSGAGLLADDPWPA